MQPSARLDALRRSALPVLLMGEPGTGKEWRARYLLGGLSVVTVDCAALPRRLTVPWVTSGGDWISDPADIDLEHGRARVRLDPPRMRLGEGEALLLDHIDRAGEGLRRLIDEASRSRRLVGMTNADPETATQALGGLLEGLQVFRCPPLRTMPEVVLPALRQELAKRRLSTEIAPTCERYLCDWPWYGNFREVQGLADYWSLEPANTRWRIRDLPQRMLEPPIAHRPGLAHVRPHIRPVRYDLSYMDARARVLEDFQRLYIHAHLMINGGNVAETSRQIGVARRSVQRILTKLRELFSQEGENVD